MADAEHNWVIRDTTPADFGAMAGLTNTFILSTAIHFGSRPVDEAEFEKLWVEGGSGRRHVWLTAELAGGAFAGYAKSGTWRAREAYRWTAEVGIYLEPAAQGRGLGRALYAALLEKLRHRGFQSAVGGITMPNPASVRLHESLGFVHTGTVARAGFKMGRWHDVSFWQKMLGEGGAPREPGEP